MNDKAMSHPAFLSAPYQDQIRKLESACRWLKIDQGRAAAYVRLVLEFHERGSRTEEHVLAFNESCEIVDLFELWKSNVDRFPGIKEKLRSICRKGPTLREQENPKESTNRPRNDAFGYLVAGTLMSAGISVVSVEGVARDDAEEISGADLCFIANGLPVDVECKRPQVKKEMVPRFNEARRQIEGREGRTGAIAIDCSAVIRPSSALLEYESAAAGEGKISRILATQWAPLLVPLFTPVVVGVMLMARVPAIMRLPASSILDSRGMPIRPFRRDSILTWLIVTNSRARIPSPLGSVAERIEASHGRLNLQG